MSNNDLRAELDRALTEFPKDEPIAVFGRRDHRSNWDEVETKRKDRHFITLSRSPVGNQFEHQKALSRLEQIDAHRKHIYEYWILKGEISFKASEWIDARVADFKAGIKVDLICDCRQRSRKPQAVIGRNEPHDCHGHTLRGLILWRAVEIEASQFMETVLSYRDSQEGPRE